MPKSLKCFNILCILKQTKTDKLHSNEILTSVLSNLCQENCGNAESKLIKV